MANLEVHGLLMQGGPEGLRCTIGSIVVDWALWRCWRPVLVFHLSRLSRRGVVEDRPSY